MKIANVTCYAYFRGRDGLGTCDDGCQWFVKEIPCPHWLTEDEWEIRISMINLFSLRIRDY